MIQQQTIVKILDNSGAKNVKCIQCKAGKRFSRLGDSIVVTVKELRTKSRRTSKVLKGEVHTAIITTTKSAFRRKDGSILYSGNNSAVLIGISGKTIGTRVLGPLPRILRNVKQLKLASMSIGFL